MRAILATLALLFCLPAMSGAEENRRVLALWDSTDPYGKFEDESQVHRLLEAPLNRLGLTLEYADASVRPLPDPKPYRAIVAWFSDDRLPDPAGYCRWLAAAANSGVRLILFDGFGADQTEAGAPADPAAAAEAYAALGVQLDAAAGTSDDLLTIEATDKQAGAFRFETKVPPDRASYLRLVPIRDDVRVWRSLSLRGKEQTESAAVFTSPRGGFVLDAASAMRELPGEPYSIRWNLHPERFLEEALGCAGTPRPDVTTVCGARAAFSHIDGDGMDNITQDVPGPHRYAAAVVLDEVLRRYPVPVSVGLIASQIDPKARAYGYVLDAKAGEQDQQVIPPPAPAAADRRFQELHALGRAIHALPNVQAATHGYAHPMLWMKGTVGMHIPGYDFSETMETTGAMKLIEAEMLPAGSRVGLFLWTGDCRPGPGALEAVAAHGAVELNGGNARYDALHASLFHICALSRSIAGRRQTYAPAGSENLYTSLWTENFGGFRNVIDTFERTETPRRLPVNIYYHFYCAERLAGLESLRQIHAWALKQPLCWIHAEEYSRAVAGFHAARIGPLEGGGWWIENRGALDTLRLDDCALHLDPAASRNILGYVHHAGSLYVALAPGDRAEIRLVERETPRPCVRRSTSRLRKVTLEEAGVKAEARLYAPGFLEVRGFPPGTEVTALVGTTQTKVKTDAEGVARIALPAGRGEWTEVRLGR